MHLLIVWDTDGLLEILSTTPVVSTVLLPPTGCYSYYSLWFYFCLYLEHLDQANLSASWDILEVCVVCGCSMPLVWAVVSCFKWMIISLIFTLFTSCIIHSCHKQTWKFIENFPYQLSFKLIYFNCWKQFKQFSSFIMVTKDFNLFCQHSNAPITMLQW